VRRPTSSPSRSEVAVLDSRRQARPRHTASVLPQPFNPEIRSLHAARRRFRRRSTAITPASHARRIDRYEVARLTLASCESADATVLTRGGRPSAASSRSTSARTSSGGGRQIVTRLFTRWAPGSTQWGRSHGGATGGNAARALCTRSKAGRPIVVAHVTHAAPAASRLGARLGSGVRRMASRIVWTSAGVSIAVPTQQVPGHSRQEPHASRLV
jgi:hypothetical protein